MPSLNISDLAWAPDVRSHWRLQGIDLQVREGEFVGLIGPNGSGKTSLLRCAYRAERPVTGWVALDGEDLWQRSPRWSAQRIAVVLQEFPQDFGLAVAEVVAMGRSPHKGLFDGDDAEDAAMVAQALASVGMADFHAHPFARLSGGEKQRVLLARALVQRPGLLLLDEPTSAVDPQSRREFWNSLFELAEAGTTLLVSTHYMDEAERCTRLGILDAGRLVADGSPAELMGALPGHPLLIECAQPRQAQRALQGADEVIAMAQIGASLRVLSAEANARERIARRLAGQGVQAEVKETEPNLEDVFVTVTHQPLQKAEAAR